jgi:hypothetical protein
MKKEWRDEKGLTEEDEKVEVIAPPIYLTNFQFLNPQVGLDDLLLGDDFCDAES